MFLSIVLLERTHEDPFIVRSTGSRIRTLLSGIENMKALFGMDFGMGEEEKHS